MTSFAPAERRWIERLGNLRNIVRQEMIARQLALHVADGMVVLDVGCGQGTQALRLASSGCLVTGIDPSPDLLQLCTEAATSDGLEIETLQGRLDDLEGLCGARRFDMICCHGVMMYLDDRVHALGVLSGHLKVDGILSVTFRNGHALAMRPGLRGDWPAALSSFDSTAYVNELGLHATADSVHGIELALASAGLNMVTWYGVRVFNDAVSTDVDPPSDEVLRILLDAEERAGATEPYKWMASQLHVIASPASTTQRP
jgi:S-adenosylmethionine-dependent methyltransferase